KAPGKNLRARLRHLRPTPNISPSTARAKSARGGKRGDSEAAKAGGASDCRAKCDGHFRAAKPIAVLLPRETGARLEKRTGADGRSRQAPEAESFFQQPVPSLIYPREEPRSPPVATRG